ncbi:hypothetical protein QIS99_28365 [Streptomyces sp. B-S-A8]|uniref:Uncharacterized protein n=1 Tax=Streptomyces solicavernae TaxID=3043614 RepID=A0ABT6S0H0_9ACTN|nr:hypothetical protein [Streptomyces sp. B-S-A8]MDI3390075.1 hypothetical protein [Streptomyces sp. B-S-A8]
MSDPSQLGTSPVPLVKKSPKGDPSDLRDKVKKINEDTVKIGNGRR